jgi:hypothetical protein
MKASTTVPALAGALLVLASAGRAAAQTPEFCPAVLEAVAGDPEIVVDMPEIVQCGDPAGSVVADALRGTTMITSTWYWQQFGQIANQIRHPALLAAALDVARAGSASLPARAVALGIALHHAEPNAGFTLAGSPLSWDQLVAAQVDPAEAPYCVGASSSGSSAPPFVNATMPAGFERSIATAADQVGGDAAAPAGIRGMAKCLRSALMEVAPPLVDVTKLHIARVCARKVKVTNDNPFIVEVTLRILNTERTTEIYAPPGETIFPMDEDGAVILEYEGQDLGIAQIGAPCP